MKNYILYILFGFFLVSCSNEKEVIINKDAQDEILERPQGDFKGMIPEDHPLYTIIYKNYETSDLRQLDALYKKHIAPERNKHYTENLKNGAFLIMIKKGLIKEGTNEQKRYYLREQETLSLNLPCTMQFYGLLGSCKNFMSKDEMREIAVNFYNKNVDVINTSYWPDEKNKIAAKSLLDNVVNDFSLQISLNK